MPSSPFGPYAALLLVDLQNDFFAPGPLPVAASADLFENVNGWIEAAERADLPIFASRDWHPPGHASFSEQGGEWPEHCVRETPGAQICSSVKLPAETRVIDKGESLEKDQYSPFEVPELGETLWWLGVNELWIAGVASEVCVRACVLDALRDGYSVHLIVEALAPVEAESGQKALREMQEAGAMLE